MPYDEKQINRFFICDKPKHSFSFKQVFSKNGNWRKFDIEIA